MQFLTNAHFDFVGKRKLALIMSAVVIGAGLVSLAIKRGPALSIDFRGGTIVELRIEPAAPIGEVRSALSSAGIAADGVQSFGDAEEVLIYIAAHEGELTEESRVTSALRAALPDRTIEERRVETVGPKIGGELKTAALNSIFVALLLIVVYVSLRFDFHYALAAVVALMHDVLVTVGIFSLFNREISLTVLAALLTIVGYSLNDTIVIFDRVRENMGLRRKESYESIINKSINETLSRTLITALTTFFTSFMLFLFGGPVIRDFALAMTIGVVAGTYSTIYIASPIVIAWYHWRSADGKRGAPRSGGKKQPDRATV